MFECWWVEVGDALGRDFGGRRKLLT